MGYLHRSDPPALSTPRGSARRRAAGLALIVAALVSLAIFGFYAERARRAGPVQQIDPLVAASLPHGAEGPDLARPIYPYSIVDGGVQSVDELKAAIERDPVVAAHFANFDLAKTRIEILDEPRIAHVSYRLGDEVYWTRKRVRLPAGERVISDGKNTARTRCANQICERLEGPTSPLEPPEAVMDAPLPPLQRHALAWASGPLSVPGMLAPPATVPGTPSTLGPPGGPYGPGGGVPIGPIFVPRQVDSTGSPNGPTDPERVAEIHDPAGPAVADSGPVGHPNGGSGNPGTSSGPGGPPGNAPPELPILLPPFSPPGAPPLPDGVPPLLPPGDSIPPQTPPGGDPDDPGKGADPDDPGNGDDPDDPGNGDDPGDPGNGDPTIPEPGTMLLMAIGGGIAIRRMVKRSAI